MESAVLRRRDLLEGGWSDGRLTRALRGGIVTRVGRDRYVLPGFVPTIEQIVARPGSATALSHASAARAWGLPAADPRTHVVVPHGSRRHAALTHGPVVVHQTRGWSAVPVGDVVATDVLTTVVDLLRAAELSEAVAVLDAALHGGRVSATGVSEAIGSRVRGNTRARRALQLSDGRAESPLESRLRLLLTLDGHPPDDLQHEVREDGRFVARVDLWYDTGLVVEADGYEFHRERADYVADRRKAQAYARLGLVLLRFSWDDVQHRPDLVVSTVRQVLGRSRAA